MEAEDRMAHRFICFEAVETMGGDLLMCLGFPGGSVVENPPAVQEIQVQYPLEKEMVTTPVFLLGESHEQRSLAGYSP